MKKLLPLLLLLCLLTSTAQATTTCPSCNAENQIYNYCAYCGTRIPESCSACGQIIPEDVRFNYCAYCGMKLAYVAGDTILFGSYEQDGDLTNGSEPIEWIILAAEDDSLTLISRYGFGSHTYDTSGKTGVTWETSMLRQMLNTDFYNEAFSKDEQSLILTTTVSTRQENQTVSITTTDKVYLPDFKEFYELSESMRICWKPPYTDYAREYPCFWWLRDGGCGNLTGVVASFMPSSEIDWYACNGLSESSIRPVIRVIAP